MKRTFTFFLLLLTSFTLLYAQSLYDDSESPASLRMVYTTGTYQRGVDNPAPDGYNNSSKVSSFTRSNEEYCVFVLNSGAPAKDVGPYLTGAKRFTFDVYSEHPGTVVQISIASAHKASADYPVGRHSDYSATTTKTNEWETLTFTYAGWRPDASVENSEIDQFSILFDPEKTTSEGRTYYFDNFFGPERITPEPSRILFENNKDISLLDYTSTGTLTRGYENPSTTGENTSQKVTRYQRSSQQFDEIIMDPLVRINNVEPFLANRKKMTLQFYSEFPGTEVVIIFSNSDKNIEGYPHGVHSDYKAYTSKTNEWETLVFDFGWRPDITVSNSEIDRITLNIAPNTNYTNTYYFDNFHGPHVFYEGTAQLSINEFMASNGNTIADYEGDREDWIEIYNSGDGSLNLRGHYLSDNDNNPTKWIFPGVIINPGDYLLVFASGKDTIFPNGEAHTNFRISSQGEPIRLSSPDGEEIDHVSAVSLQRDRSYGRLPDGNGEWAYLSNASPGASNNSTPSYAGLITEVPSFSVNGGFYQEPVALTIHAGSEYVIRYTLNGSEPDENSPVFSSEISISDRSGEPNLFSNIRTTYLNYVPWYAPEENISKATTVRARLFKEGHAPGPIVTNTYFIGEELATKYQITVWSIVTDSMHLFSKETGIYVPGKAFEDWQTGHPDEVPDGATPANYNQRGMDWERSASVEFFEPENAGGFKMDAGLRVHGGWSRAMTQKSFRFHFRNQYSSRTLEYPVFPELTQKINGRDDLNEFRRLILRQSGSENSFTYFRDALAHKLIEHTSVSTQAYRLSAAYLNGEYWGLYNIRERIDKSFLASHFKVDPEMVTILQFSGNLKEGKQKDADDYLALLDYIRNNDINNDAVYEHVKSKIDIANYIDYHLAQVFYGNHDWPGNNILYWRLHNGNINASLPGHDGRWRWILQDVDFGFGFDSSPEHNTLEMATLEGGTEWPNQDWATFLFRTLLQNPEFKNEFINRLADHMNTSFKPERIQQEITKFESALEPVIQEQIHRFQSPYDYNYWKEQIEVVRNFAENRIPNQQQHILDYFGLSGTTTVTVDVHQKRGGEIKISSLRLNNKVPGINEKVYPWTGTYFKDVPVTVSAIPEAGYRFTGWNGNSASNEDTTITLQEAVSLTAYFEPLTEGGEFPRAHILAQADYTLSAWSNNSEAGTYPPSMVFLQSRTVDPGLATPMEDPYAFSYNLDRRTRIEGLNDNGFAFINTGTSNDVLPNAEGRDLGAAVLALNTLNVKKAYISFKAGTELSNRRIYAIRLQYRAGNTTEFRDIIHQGEPVIYLTNTDGHSEHFENIELPEEALNQPYIQVRWVYHHITGISGPRAKLRIDDISVNVEETQEEDLTAVTDTNDGGVKLYPNPSDGNFKVVFSGNYTGKVTITITDIKGRQIFTETYYKDSEQKTWGMKNMIKTSGIYFVKWQTQESTGVERVLVIDTP
ncbi:CotH kinase family protein [Cytophagaceae bacterium ABcell3]|nr:CotH kinase family protein [Cytophagaceae bacterium ABcell3]